jgi:hypothetical protein
MSNDTCYAILLNQQTENDPINVADDKEENKPNAVSMRKCDVKITLNQVTGRYKMLCYVRELRESLIYSFVKKIILRHLEDNN